MQQISNLCRIGSNPIRGTKHYDKGANMYIVTLIDGSHHQVADLDHRYTLFGDAGWIKSVDNKYFKLDKILYVTYTR